MTTENRERLIDLLQLVQRVEQARVQHLPDEIVDFFVFKAEELTLRRQSAAAERSFLRRASGFNRAFVDHQAALEVIDELLQSMHDTVAAFDSEGLGSWQTDFDRWHAARSVKH